MKPELLLYDDKGNVLKVFKDGRVICDCLNNYWNKERDYASFCSHARQLTEAICEGDITNYQILNEN